MFISPPTRDTAVNLNFSAHLHVLRSYLLLTNHAFNIRLRSALFSDHVDRTVSVSSTYGLVFKQQNESNLKKVWSVGLAPLLTERETWPPFGADLSPSLRTVIVDTLNASRRDLERLKGEVEVESYLGFAVREDGRDKWFDPLSESIPFNRESIE
jgi:hypothetical protein